MTYQIHLLGTGLGHHLINKNIQQRIGALSAAQAVPVKHPQPLLAVAIAGKALYLRCPGIATGQKTVYEHNGAGRRGAGLCVDAA
jgi:hypothetical protein